VIRALKPPRGWLTALRPLLAVSFAAAAGLGTAPSIASAAPTPPPASTSRYSGNLTGNQSTDYANFYDEGSAQGQAGLTTVVILDFAGQDSQSGQMGTTDWSGHFHPDAEIEAAVEGYVKGYYDAASRLGPPFPAVLIGIGTNNSLNEVSSAGGQDWAEVANTVAQWAASHFPPLDFSIYGANDLEPGFSQAADAEAWATGFSGAPSGQSYFDFGSADGCPTSGTGQGSNGGCSNGWRQSDVYQVSWGVPAAFPLPDIYRTDGTHASQWEQISRYGHYNQPYPTGYDALDFYGAMTQYEACQQVDNCNHGLPDATDNTPGAGWSQLYDAANCNGATPCPTANGVPYFQTTDIRWDN
jgi:hypothetical protein